MENPISSSGSAEVLSVGGGDEGRAGGSVGGGEGGGSGDEGKGGGCSLLGGEDDVDGDLGGGDEGKGGGSSGGGDEGGSGGGSIRFSVDGTVTINVGITIPSV